MADPLLSIPGLGGYLAQKQRNEQQGAQQLQQYGTLVQLQNAIQTQKQAGEDRQRNEAMMAEIAKIPPEQRNKATVLPIIMKYARTPKDVAGMLPEEQKPQSIGAGGLRLPTGKIVPPAARPEQPKPPVTSPLAKLIAERDALPQGDSRRKAYDAAIAKAGNPGVNVTTNLTLGKEGQNKVDTGLLDTTQGLMRLSAIEGQYRPEFQQFSGKLSAGWSSLKDKAGVTLAPEDKQFLTDFSSYKRNAINSMNEYIKSITGAAMSEPEAQRILRGMPNPGQGMFDGDSPTEFKAKLDDAMKQTRLVLARYEYIKRNGIGLSDARGNAVIPLERMPEIMNQRGRVLEQQFKAANQNATQQQIQSSVRDVLAKEFGLIR